MSTGGRSEKSLSAPELILEILSCLCLREEEPVSVTTVDVVFPEERICEGSVAEELDTAGGFRFLGGWLEGCCLDTDESAPERL